MVEVEWSAEDKEKLVEAVANMSDDWDEISKIAFDGEYSPEECALQFISLPITESLHLRL